VGLFDDVLLTVDFDRTMSAPDSSIPERNLKAVRFFMENGGTFTMNTGRTTNNFRKQMEIIPVNAPFLLYNGSAAYDNGKLTNCVSIDLPMWQTLIEIHEAFPDMNLEIHGAENHYLVEPSPEYINFYETAGWNYAVAVPGSDVGPFLKFAVFGKPGNNGFADMYSTTPEELARFAQMEAFLREHYGDKLEVFRPAPRILNVHAKGVSKIKAARRLQEQLGKKILVCAGDAENDIPMLDGADYAFCPADGVVAERYPNVCPCAQGAVADVIYKKIPEILGFSLDNPE